MNKKLLIFLFIILLLGVAGCGKSTKDKKEILQDLQSECDIFAQNNLDIISFEITNRKTNSEGKRDVVYCYIVAQNENMKYLCDYTITYFLYDQGWFIEEILDDNEQFIPLYTSITQSQASEEVEESLIQLSYEYQTSFSFDKEEINLDKSTHLFYFVNDTKTLQLIVEYNFDGKWSLSGSWFEEIK